MVRLFLMLLYFGGILAVGAIDATILGFATTVAWRQERELLELLERRRPVAGAK